MMHGELTSSGVQGSPPQHRQQPQQHQQQQQPQQPGEEGEAIDKHQRAPKGTAGTFNGRRPPKDPAKLQLFLAEKDMWLKEREEARQQRQMERQRQNKPEPTLSQVQYRAFMRGVLQQDNSADAFSDAAKHYGILMKKEACS